MGIVTLVSGGIDSVVMAKFFQNQGEDVLPIFVDYGQLAADKEWEACQTLFRECFLPEVIRADLSGYGKFIPSGLTEKNIGRDKKETAFLPGRNMLFLLLGAAYAKIKGEKIVAIGFLLEEAHMFPDQTEEFVVNANFALNSALGDDIIIVTPLINFDKNQVIELARKYRVPLDKTYSCHTGKDRYCGKCVACKELIDSGNRDVFPQFGGRD